jgi:fructose-1,6-bisphosphatase/inositol monophosphatase family enzyme
MNLDADIALALRLADAAGEAIRPYFRSGVESERKGDATPVTLADRAGEEAMRRILKAEVPQDAVVGEEFGASTGSSDEPGCSTRSTARPRSSSAGRSSAR